MNAHDRAIALIALIHTIGIVGGLAANLIAHAVTRLRGRES